MKQIILSLVLSFMFIGCGKGGDSGSGAGVAPTSAKTSVFSEWVYTNGAKLDFRTGSLDRQLAFTLFFTDGTCQCNVLASGAETNGSYAISGCTLVSGSRNCSVLNENGTFIVVNSTMTACATGGSCTTYK